MTTRQDRPSLAHRVRGLHEQALFAGENDMSSSLSQSRVPSVQMRRALAIFLTLFFGLGPLTALAAESGDTRLPACCRRHGAHHCAMSDGSGASVGARDAGSMHFFAPPVHCPLYPHGTPAPSSSTHAIAVAHAQPSVLLAAGYRSIEHRLALANRSLRTLSVRGPPSPAIA